MNNVCLSGNITKPIELRSTQSGKQVASFSLAINESKDHTEFVNCVAWDKTAELINQYCQKGDRLACVGRLQTRKWEKDGQTRYATEVIVSSFDFPPKRAESHTPAPSVPDDLEDEIPFMRIPNEVL
jgi:single-strand DNA-binding protein